MGITNPQTFADLSAIENIDSIDVQKAFLRVILEFLYLQDSDEMSGDQAEVLDYFSVNKKQAAAIENEVSQLFKIVGPVGVAEKYGYVPEDTEDAVESNNTGTSLASQGCGNYEINDSDIKEFIGNMGFHGYQIVETENYVIAWNNADRTRSGYEFLFTWKASLKNVIIFKAKPSIFIDLSSVFVKNIIFICPPALKQKRSTTIISDRAFCAQT